MLNFLETIKPKKETVVQLWEKTDGNTSVMFAVSLSTLLLGLTAAIDLTSTFSMKAKMQDALDAAVLAAAISADEDNFLAIGQSAYELNISEGRLASTKVSFEKSTTNDVNAMVGTASGSLPLFFSGVFKNSAMDISVRSVVNVSKASHAPACVIALSRTAQPGVVLNSGSRIEGPGCELHVHSETSNALNVNSGININLARTCVAGSGVTDNSNGAIGLLKTDCNVEIDPYAGKIPEPTSVSCDYSNGNYDNPPGGKISMQPGVYCGWHNFNNSNVDVEFAPGLYVIRGGGWNVNGGNWSGEGVTFYMYDTSLLNFNSNVNASFSAPTSGDYEGIFLTERPGLTKRDYNMNSASNFDFDGGVYLPSKRLTMNSGSAMHVRTTTLVADKIILNGAIGFETEATGPLSAVSLSPYLAE